jgi:hypothetical protein
MELSRHAAVRKRQRGFQADDIELIIYFGTRVSRPGNVVEYQMRKKNEKHLVQALDRVKDKGVLLSKDEATVVTVYTLDKKHKGGKII